jgi:cob(I)alamin adenosyltransferase
MVLVFIGWLFFIRKIFSGLPGRTNEWSTFQESWSKIGNIFDEFKVNLEKIKEKLPKEKAEQEEKPTLSEEEIKRLEEKILEYTKENSKH